MQKNKSFIHIYKTADQLNNDVANWIADQIASTLKKQDRFTIALSGGNTPEQLHKILAASPYKEQIEWSKLHIFWGDERDVPFDDERNNAKMAFDTLLNYVPVPKSQIHIMRTDIPPDQSATEYEKILHQYFGTNENVSNSFDLVLLGMGDDGHTLSLFPGTEIVHEEKAWAKAFFLQAQNMYRISITKSITNRSSRIAFLTTGKNKAAALEQVLEGNYNPDLYPAQVINPLNGELHWFVDKDAAVLLKSTPTT
ncbi:MAG: 6-phosphogluconolactonase [Bacteroidetes bacterium]|nr:6-phosphogluconolactonase [Bacteroidota bacterium]